MAADHPSAETTVTFERETPSAGMPRDLISSSQPGPSSEKQRLQSAEDAEKNSAKGVPEEQHDYVTGVKLILILVPTTLVYFLLMLDGSIVSTAIPEITSEFDSLLDVGWCVHRR